METKRRKHFGKFIRMNKDATLIIEQCLDEKIEECRLILKSDLAKLSLSQLETFNNKIADLEYAKSQLKGDK
jgi:hypothetical protein